MKRRLASWGTLHRWKGQEGRSPRPSLRAALRLAVRATRPRRRKSKRAVTRDVLDRLLATCRSDRLADTRDLPSCCCLRLRRAPAQRGRAAAGRAAQRRAAGAARSADPKSPTLPCLAIQLGRTKTGNADEEGRVLLVGPPVEALREWLSGRTSARGRSSAPSIWEAVEERALTPQSINLIVSGVADGGARGEGVFRPRA